MCAPFSAEFEDKCGPINMTVDYVFSVDGTAVKQALDVLCNICNCASDYCNIGAVSAIGGEPELVSAGDAEGTVAPALTPGPEPMQPEQTAPAPATSSSGKVLSGVIPIVAFLHP